MGLSLFEQIQNLAKTGRTPVQGTFDPVTGGSTAARSKTVPQSINEQSVSKLTGNPLPAQTSPTTPSANLNPDATPAPPDPAVKKAQNELDQIQTEETRRRRGASANLLTGPSGLLSTPNTARRSLMGF